MPHIDWVIKVPVNKPLSFVVPMASGAPCRVCEKSSN